MEELKELTTDAKGFGWKQTESKNIGICLLILSKLTGAAKGRLILLKKEMNTL